MRSIVLGLCGTALQHRKTPPALVNAILAVQMYGKYFVDPWERQALKGIVQQFKDVGAWPVPNALQSF